MHGFSALATQQMNGPDALNLTHCQHHESKIPTFHSERSQSRTCRRRSRRRRCIGCGGSSGRPISAESDPPERSEIYWPNPPSSSSPLYTLHTRICMCRTIGSIEVLLFSGFVSGGLEQSESDFEKIIRSCKFVPRPGPSPKIQASNGLFKLERRFRTRSIVPNLRPETCPYGPTCHFFILSFIY